MQIDIFKSGLFKDLEQHNQALYRIGDKYNYDGLYGSRNRRGTISGWFDPRVAKKIPVSAKFPNPHPDQLRPEYNLILFASNYLALFLINELYSDRKDVLIEDAGSGVGRELYYLAKLGFTNLQGIDNFSQSSKEMFIDHEKAAGVPFKINNLDTKPVIMTNGSAPFTFINPRFGRDNVATKIEEPYNLEKLELICFYAKRFNDMAEDVFPKHGLKRLCYDQHNFANAYCREDKFEEFSEKLEGYKIGY